MVFTSVSPIETLSFSEKLGNLLKEGDVILLCGELGAGKTTFIKGVCKSKRIDTDKVTSPSFVILNIYYGDVRVFHFDFFRLNPKEVLELGIYDYLKERGLFLIEWADRAEDILEKKDLRIELEHIDYCKRKIILRALTRRGSSILREFRKIYL